MAFLRYKKTRGNASTISSEGKPKATPATRWIVSKDWKPKTVFFQTLEKFTVSLSKP